MLSRWLTYQKKAWFLGPFPRHRVRRFDGELTFIEEKIEQRNTRMTVTTALVTDGDLYQTAAHHFPAQTDHITGGYNESLKDVAVRGATYVLVVHSLYGPGSRRSGVRSGVSRVYLTAGGDPLRVAQQIERHGGFFPVNPRDYKRPARLATA